ncbi:hypothetical protein [Nonomuraea sp. NPDC046570]|uniref:hypothetical protein n=1 Tax=Nonomuraea sp. NPDC046570 TaxID=3155255 RepID=UPI0033D3927B
MTHPGETGPPLGEAVSPVTALAGACERFATHVQLLADQLAAAQLSPDDIEQVQAAVHRAVNAAVLTTGLRRVPRTA